MSKQKKKDVLLPKRFNADDIAKWQKIADKETRGNLNLWMELILNKAASRYKDN